VVTFAYISGGAVIALIAWVMLVVLLNPNEDPGDIGKRHGAWVRNIIQHLREQAND